MKLLYKAYILLVFFSFSFVGLAHGLKFNGNESLINERTSYNVFNTINPTFKDSLSISFDFSPEKISQVGYIFRIKTQYPNLIFNLSYDSHGPSVIYNLNTEGKSTLISEVMSKHELRIDKWVHIKVKLDLVKGEVTFCVGKHIRKAQFDLPKTIKPEIYFGLSDYFIDVPSFSIKELKINARNKSYYFPLKEHQGEIVFNDEGEEFGIVKNPIWLINKAYYWNHVAAFKSKQVAGFNYDSISQQIYYFNRDSLIKYDLHQQKIEKEFYANKCPIHPRLGYNFLSSIEKCLYVYEVSLPLAGEVTIARYNLADKEWSTVSNDTLPKQLHHHGRFFDKSNNRFIIFGGFGHMFYNNEFNCFNLNTNKWEKLHFEGDTIFPRYFLSMGYDEKSNCLYIFGGMGNESGEYNVGRKYFYDLYKVDLTKKYITRLWDIPWTGDYVVPVKSMIINDNHITTLCYSEHFSDSFLRLYRFSMSDGSYETLGDSIPIHSEKITTNADLFYSKELGELYGIVQEFEDDDMASSLNIYSLSAPGVSSSELFGSVNKSNKKAHLFYWSIFTIFATFLALLIGIKVIKKQKDLPDEVDNEIETNRYEDKEIAELGRRPNAIYLFGRFYVFNRRGKDITYMFSARLKQAFLLILLNSYEDGITTQQLTDMLWEDRDDDKAKNIRGVTINNIRKILEELDGVKLVYDKSFYKVIVEGNCFCDYLKCLELIEINDGNFNISTFAELLYRGKFLKNEEDSLYDSFKSFVESKIEPVLKMRIENSLACEDYSTAIKLCISMFNIDPLNELALSSIIKSMVNLNQEREAKKQYYKFVTEYRKMIGEEYKNTFNHFS